MRILLGQGSCRNPTHAASATFAADRAEQRTLGLAGDAGSFELLVQINFEIVVARHFVMLAAFFVQADPQAPVLNKNILDFHGERSANARERIDHETNQGTIAQADVCADVDALEQAPRVVRRQDGRLAFLHHMARSAYGRGRIDAHDLAEDKPIEQVTNGCKARFDRGRGSRASCSI
jgi:hypothetical protein